MRRGTPALILPFGFVSVPVWNSMTFDGWAVPTVKVELGGPDLLFVPVFCGPAAHLPARRPVCTFNGRDISSFINWERGIEFGA